MTLTGLSADQEGRSTADTCPGPCSRSVGYLMSRSHHTSSCQVSHDLHTSQRRQCWGRRHQQLCPISSQCSLQTFSFLGQQLSCFSLELTYPRDYKQAVPNTYYLLVRTGSLVSVSPLLSPPPPFFP